MRLNLSIIFLIIFSLTGVFISNADGYVDPNSGSIIIQIIIGALVGASFTIKLYWRRLKEKILRRDKKVNESE